MIRTFPLGGAEIEVTFQWDSGDPSVGIPAHWGEDTCTVVRAGGVETVFIYEPADEPVAQWKIREVQVNYRAADGTLKGLTYKTDAFDALGELPAVCEAVEQAWQQVIDHAAVESAGEDCWGYEAEISELEFHLSPEFGYDAADPRREQLQHKLAEARTSFQAAKAHHERLKAAYDAAYATPREVIRRCPGSSIPWSGES